MAVAVGIHPAPVPLALPPEFPGTALALHERPFAFHALPVAALLFHAVPVPLARHAVAFAVHALPVAAFLLHAAVVPLAVHAVAFTLPPGLAVLPALFALGLVLLPVFLALFSRTAVVLVGAHQGRGIQGGARQGAGEEQEDGEHGAPLEAGQDHHSRGGGPAARAQNTDQPVRVVKRSRASTPATELPQASRAGPQVQRVPRPGMTARRPPPTPLFTGRPTR